MMEYSIDTGTDQIPGKNYLLAQNIISLSFLRYVPKREIINCSHVSLKAFKKKFTKALCENVVEASVIKVLPFKGSVDLILNLSSVWTKQKVVVRNASDVCSILAV